MDEELDYLWETLGLEITADLWPERDKIHPTLRPAITVVQAKYRRASFICPGVQAYLPFMDEEYWSGKPNKHVTVYDPHEWAQLAD